ncbi:hypothetical protein JZ751_000524 [Albula glossodonta]|uniref:Uncharacterized protein n=1 Tax=Albula glossodonta TaxID=121402 RepID=A0A8T2PWU3_9TELE|nr:hypothetical protein JZ751_000524 [Albula glossodonta]
MGPTHTAKPPLYDAETLARSTATNYQQAGWNLKASGHRETASPPPPPPPPTSPSCSIALKVLKFSEQKKSKRQGSREGVEKGRDEMRSVQMRHDRADKTEIRHCGHMTPPPPQPYPTAHISTAIKANNFVLTASFCCVTTIKSQEISVEVLCLPVQVRCVKKSQCSSLV